MTFQDCNIMQENNLNTLKEKLNENPEWPRLYFFKFIIPSDNETLAKVQALFGDEANVKIKQSSKGNYVSFSAKELMLNADTVIEKYKEALKIKGLIAL